MRVPASPRSVSRFGIRLAATGGVSAAWDCRSNHEQVGRTMHRTEKGFTLIELMIVVVIIGILAAIAIPNFIAMQDRAKEGSTKANMHTFQLASEDYGVQNNGTYAPDCATVAPLLPRGGANFNNPFSSASAAYVDAGAWA